MKQMALVHFLVIVCCDQLSIDQMIEQQITRTSKLQKLKKEHKTEHMIFINSAEMHIGAGDGGDDR